MPKAAAKTSQAKTVGGGHPRSPNGARSETEKDIERIQRTYGAQIGMSLRKKFAELGGKKHGNRFNPQQRQLVPRLAQHVEKILTSFWLRQCDQLLAQTKTDRHTHLVCYSPDLELS